MQADDDGRVALPRNTGVDVMHPARRKRRVRASVDRCRNDARRRLSEAAHEAVFEKHRRRVVEGVLGGDLFAYAEGHADDLSVVIAYAVLSETAVDVPERPRCPLDLQLVRGAELVGEIGFI